MNWAKTAVVYHIYPLSFKDANGDGYGDLAGILEKLDYLNDGTEKSLGVDAIWLSPVYKSPLADWGYDVSDYYDIDPLFGDLATLNRLLGEVHKRGMKLLMDFVPNHTSIEHPWFKESRSSKENSKRNWYIWKDPKPDGSPPNNWIAYFGESAWTYDQKTGQYYLHSFLPEQPDLNWRNPEVREAMLEVLRFWLRRGVDGFRTDAAYHLIKDAEFRDDPPSPTYVPGKDHPYRALRHLYSVGQPEIFSTTEAICEVLSENWMDKFVVSEIYIDLPEMVKFYRACKNKHHSPLNFNLIDLPWSAASYRDFIDRFEQVLDPEDVPTYVLGNHDRPRVAQRLGRGRARLLAVLLLTLRGMPFIYYGDEIGMAHGTIPESRIQDPAEKLVPGLGAGRDPERTPMQWNSSRVAGFSDAEPWLPVADDYPEYNVEKESQDPTSMLSLYRRLIHFRKQTSAILFGKYRPLDAGNKDTFAYLRENGEEKVAVILNFAGEEREAKLDLGKAKVVCNSFMDIKEGEVVLPQNLRLRPYEGYVLTI